jgi:hypothetical protein
MTSYVTTKRFGQIGETIFPEAHGCQGGGPAGAAGGAVLDDMPDHPLRYTPSPSLAGPANAPKHAAINYACRNEPRVDGGLDPVRKGHGSNVTSLPRSSRRRSTMFKSSRDPIGPTIMAPSIVARLNAPVTFRYCR